MAGCTEDTVVIPNHMQIAYVEENRYALLECIPGYEFPSSSDGIYWCEENEWIGTIAECSGKFLVSYNFSIPILKLKRLLHSAKQII